jgi:hypothetical protein
MLHVSKTYLGQNTAANNVTTSAVTSNADGSVLERLEYIQTVVGGGSSAVNVVFSESQTVEENAIQYFNIGLFDRDSGAIASASIDISGISAVMQKSTGGGAFATGTIAQPSFAKVNGSVYCAYQFLAADWITGDMYKLVVSGITATAHATTTYVPTGVWSNVVVETADILADVQYLYAVADGGTTSPTKVIDNSILSIILTKDSGGDTSDFNNSTDSLEAIADSAMAIFHEQADTPLTYNTDDSEGTVLSLATASTRYILRSLYLKFADPGANTITIRLKLLINDISTTVKSYTVTTDNYGDYLSLMDMFGEPMIAGDSIIVTTQNSAAVAVAVTGQYSYAKTT